MSTKKQIKMQLDLLIDEIGNAQLNLNATMRNEIYKVAKDKKNKNNKRDLEALQIEIKSELDSQHDLFVSYLKRINCKKDNNE